MGPRGSLFMVADGMGGAAAGELASAMAADLIYRHLATAWAADDDASPERFAYRMKEAVELANQQIYSYAREHPEVRGMGTTVTAAGINGDDLYLAQIGDSRAYLVRNGEAIQLTKDQSLMQRLVDAGELTEEEAEQSERRNIILQALGPDPRVKVDLTHQTLRRGDTLIICSDGLSGLVRREEFSGHRRAAAGARRPVRRADRPGQRPRRSGQHHRRRGPFRGRRAARAERGGGRGLRGLSSSRRRCRRGRCADRRRSRPPRPRPRRPPLLGSRARALLLMAAVLCLIAALLAVWL